LVEEDVTEDEDCLVSHLLVTLLYVSQVPEGSSDLNKDLGLLAGDHAVEFSNNFLHRDAEQRHQLAVNILHLYILVNRREALQSADSIVKQIINLVVVLNLLTSHVHAQLVTHKSVGFGSQVALGDDHAQLGDELLLHELNIVLPLFGVYQKATHGLEEEIKHFFEVGLLTHELVIGQN